tara:strand:- start:8853 stop:9371 length:519 start_codon:yes stop_codon:yes gene_type:complete
MKEDENYLFEQGMDFGSKKKIDSQIATTGRRVRKILGDEYYEAVEMGVYPYNYFVTEYMSDFMHRIEIVDPDNTVELVQHSLVPLASNPEGGFPLNVTKRIPEKVRIWYCINKKSGKQIRWACYKKLERNEQKKYDRYYEQFTKREIFTLLRLSAEWNTLDLEQQEAILARL